VAEKRDSLIKALEKKMVQRIKLLNLFFIQWKVI
jgi:hypothetical protein